MLESDTGRDRSFGTDRGGLASLRSTRPRALVELPPLGGLVLWDDVAGTKTMLVPKDTAVSGADWDPNGTQLVVSTSGRRR